MIDTEKEYKTALLVLALMIILLLIFWLSQMERGLNDANRDRFNLEKEIDSIEANNMLIMDSVKTLNKKLSSIEDKKLASIAAYKAKSRKEKNNDLKRFGGIVLEDNKPCLDSNATDSINKLAIQYDACIETSATKDTIIGFLTDLNANKDTIISVKDNIIASVEKTHKDYKKAAKTKVVKAAIKGGLIGLIIGLIL